MFVTVVVIPVRMLVNAVVMAFQMFWAIPEMKFQMVVKMLDITLHTAERMVLTMLTMPPNMSETSCFTFSQRAPQSPENRAANTAKRSAITLNAVLNTALMTSQTPEIAVRIVLPHVSQNAFRPLKMVRAIVLIMVQTAVSTFLMMFQTFTRASVICSPCFCQKLCRPPKMVVATVFITFQTPTRMLWMVFHAVTSAFFISLTMLAPELLQVPEDREGHGPYHVPYSGEDASDHVPGGQQAGLYLVTVLLEEVLDAAPHGRAGFLYGIPDR